MLPRLYYHFIQLEKERKDIIAKARNAQSELLKSSPPDKWNVLQILAHLLTAERLSINYIRKKSLGVNAAKDSGLFESFKFTLLKISQRLTFKYKAPDFLLMNTPTNLSLEEVEQHWEAVRNDLGIFLESFDERNLKKKIYRHPIAGRLNIIQALDFFHEHIRHHESQINRLLSK